MKNKDTYSNEKHFFYVHNSTPFHGTNSSGIVQQSLIFIQTNALNKKSTRITTILYYAHTYAL